MIPIGIVSSQPVGQAPVPPICSVALTHDILIADPSYLPADINGQVFSVTYPTDPGSYAASTALADLKQLPASGVMWVEFQRVLDADIATVVFRLVDSVTGNYVQFMHVDGRFNNATRSAGGFAYLPDIGPSDKIQVGLSYDGNIYVILEGDIGARDLTDFSDPTNPIPPSPISEFTAFAFVGVILGSSGTVGGKFVTNSEDFTVMPTGEGYDWCGNPLPSI